MSKTLTKSERKTSAKWWKDYRKIRKAWGRKNRSRIAAKEAACR